MRGMFICNAPVTKQCELVRVKKSQRCSVAGKVTSGPASHKTVIATYKLNGYNTEMSTTSVVRQKHGTLLQYSILKCYYFYPPNTFHTSMPITLNSLSDVCKHAELFSIFSSRLKTWPHTQLLPKSAIIPPIHLQLMTLYKPGLTN